MPGKIENRNCHEEMVGALDATPEAIHNHPPYWTAEKHHMFGISTGQIGRDREQGFPRYARDKQGSRKTSKAETQRTQRSAEEE